MSRIPWVRLGVSATAALVVAAWTLLIGVLPEVALGVAVVVLGLAAGWLMWWVTAEVDDDEVA